MIVSSRHHLPYYCCIALYVSFFEVLASVNGTAGSDYREGFGVADGCAHDGHRVFQEQRQPLLAPPPQFLVSASEFRS